MTLLRHLVRARARAKNKAQINQNTTFWKHNRVMLGRCPVSSIQT
jgi:hypothetical protein